MAMLYPPNSLTIKILMPVPGITTSLKFYDRSFHFLDYKQQTTLN